MTPTDVPQRRTRQRTAIADVLAGQRDFRTAQQIHDELRAHGISTGLTTVYRTVQMMADSGELDVIRTDGGESAYRRCSREHHHHLVCRQCGRTIEVWGPTVEDWARQVASEHGFTDVQHDLEIFGVCADCTARAATGGRGAGAPPGTTG